MSLKEMLSPILRRFCTSTKQSNPNPPSEEETAVTIKNEETIDPVIVPKKPFKKAYSVETSSSGMKKNVYYVNGSTKILLLLKLVTLKFFS